MAFWLYRQARGAIREYQAKKIVPTTDESHLIPETVPAYGQHKSVDNQNNIELASPRASHSLIEHPKENSKEKEEAHQQNIQRKLLLGLVLPNFLAAVDVTIVAPAIPLISSDFSSLRLSISY